MRKKFSNICEKQFNFSHIFEMAVEFFSHLIFLYFAYTKAINFELYAISPKYFLTVRFAKRQYDNVKITNNFSKYSILKLERDSWASWLTTRQRSRGLISRIERGAALILYAGIRCSST